MQIHLVMHTLYHLLTGVRPSQDAKQVIPISVEESVSPAVAAIITKAMQPNPDDRYQTAADMLWDFEHLHQNDPRTRRLKRWRRAATGTVAGLFLIGGIATFTGLKQMQQVEAAARAQAEVVADQERVAQAALEDVTASQAAFDAGDIAQAKSLALSALEKDTQYTAQAQTVLTQALGVYDLSDGFKAHLRLTLPSEPLKVKLSPGGSRVVALTSGQVTVFDSETGEQLAQLAAESSALDDLIFAGEDVLLYPGEGGLRAYDLNQKAELWSGEPATGLSLSGDGTVVAAVYKNETTATVYDVSTGEILRTVDFQGLSQSVAVNDSFADPEDSLFALNGDGTLLAASFSNGALWVYDLQNSDNDVEIYDVSDYTHFEGGFFGQYFAFSATKNQESVFAVIDMDALAQTGGFASTMPFHVQADQSGIYVSTENVLVKLDPVTGEQTEVAYTDADITSFAVGEAFTITATADDGFSVFDANAVQLGKWEDGDRSDFIGITDNYLVTACLDTPSLQLLKLENHPEAQLFAYDPDYAHSEARLSADGNTVMLFQYDSFRLYAQDGSVVADCEIPDAAQVYDQQYRREDGESYLEVIYYSGLVRRYSAKDGSILSEETGEKPDETLYEEFFTDRFRITSPLHGTPEVYDRETGELVRELETDAYLTYVTQVGDYIVTEYVTAQGERYGLLLDENCETLAKLPNLCDIIRDNMLVFDDMRGNLRESRIYSTQELLALAEKM